MTTTVPLECNTAEEVYRERLEEWRRAQLEEAKRVDGRRRVARWRWKKELERYIVNAAYTGESLRADLRMTTAHLIMSRIPTANLMLTLTFPDSVGEDRRWLLIREFMRRVFPHGQYVVGFERHRSGKLHAHALAYDEQVRRLSVRDAWHWESGGVARVEVVRSVEEAASYVAKYIVKEEAGELEFGEGV